MAAPTILPPPVTQSEKAAKRSNEGLLRLQSYGIPLFILIGGWSICAILTVSTWRDVQRLNAEALARMVSRTEAQISEQLTSYTRALDAAASFVGTFDKFSRQQWKAFAKALELPARYPGIRGIGVSLPVNDREIPGFIESVRSDGAPNFTLHGLPGFPVGKGDHAVATFVEPEETNQGTLGLDDFSEPTRRETALTARDLGIPRLTPEIILIGEKSKSSNSLLFVPVYRSGSHPTTVEERRASFVAWTFTPFNFRELLPAAMDKQRAPVSLWFFEGREAREPDLLYASEPTAVPTTFETVTHLDIDGQPFTLGWRRGPSFEPVTLASRLWTVVVSAFAALLLAILVHNLIGRRAQLEQEVEIRTRQLRESELRFRTYVEQVSDALFVTDESGAIVDANRQACASLGYSRDELLRMNVLDTEAETDRSNRAGAWRMIEKGRPINLEGRQRRKDGSVFPVEIRCGSFELLGQTFYLSLVRDISERLEAERALRSAEAQLRQAQKMDAVGQLAGGVAHDFNNILTAFSLNLGLMHETADLGAEAMMSVRELEKEASRATALTRQLLLFSRRQKVTFMPVDLNSVLDNLMKMLARLLGENIAVTWIEEKDLALIDADSGMVEQVIMNLCVNARDAMPQGGRLGLRTATVELDSVAKFENPEARDGRFARLSISDSGCGMDAATRSHLFEPFFTTKKEGKGTGLGLATVYGIVKQHHGWIDVETSPGQGSVFHVYFPIRSKASTHDPGNGAEDFPRGKGETVLVVEDEHPIRNVLVLTLQRFGYHAIEASDGPTALSRLEENQGRIRLVISDMVMPGGIDGATLIARLQARDPHLLALLVSGHIPAEIPPLSPRQAYLAKPFGAPALLATIRALLDRA